MLIIKYQSKANIDVAQREFWWRKTPLQRLAAVARLIAQARQLYIANSANLVAVYGERVLKSATPATRIKR